MDKIITKFGMTRSELADFCKDKDIDQIHEYFGGNMNTLTNALYRYAIQYKRVHRVKQRPNKRKEMIKMLSLNFGYKEIAEVFGISRQAVWTIVNGD